MPNAIAPDDRETPPGSLPRRVADAFGWGTAVVVSNITNLGTTWRDSSSRERLRLLVAVLRIAAFAVIALAIGGTWLWLLVTLAVVEAIADLDDVATGIAANRRALRMLASKPTGAPPIAEVRCSHGVTHRFLYGPAGWEEAGPAANHA
jgi:putative flippase GtrA